MNAELCMSLGDVRSFALMSISGPQWIGGYLCVFDHAVGPGEGLEVRELCPVVFNRVGRQFSDATITQETLYPRGEGFRFHPKGPEKDRSIYLIPLMTRDYNVRVLEGDVQEDYQYAPREGDHLSIHESGVVNYKSSRTALRLRGAVECHAAAVKILTLAINSFEQFGLADLNEINRPKGGYIHLPLMGFNCGAPLFLTISRVAANYSWSPPALGNVAQHHYEMYLNKRDFVFHFVVWQDTRIKLQESGLAFSWK